MDSDLIAVLVISFIVAAVIAAIAVSTVVRKYKTKVQSPTYPVENYTSLNLSHSSDRFAGKTVTRVKVSSSNNRRK